MNFNDVAVNDIFDRVVSYAMSSGRFDQVNQHEPKNSPGNGMICAIWMQLIKPVRTSGLSATSGVLVLQARIYTSFRTQPYDTIDPNVTSATCDLMGVMSGSFTFGGTVRAVDLLGATGYSLSSQAGYVEIDRQMFRVMTTTIPIIIDDMFAQEA